ncbi:spermidine synthase [Bacillus sp. AFS015802]|uniref:spermine/spermidine synthase domain-containing protein n=1 Tax=Bacillus sp. AFS015802 TaxID=2033486 RepID=UPI000BF5F90D|nr:spermidine synthase [Bacillus sp. AFS015802]PFA68436.1 spermidine synthase [Bacillus sp. AFS015802]
MSRRKNEPWLADQFGPLNDGEGNRRNHMKIKRDIERVDSSGDEWDRVGLKEILAGDHTNLYQGQSKFQDIHLLCTEDIRLYLNGQLQFSSVDERIYHEAFVHIPFALTGSVQSVLVLGGGDGLALREILKYQEVRTIDLVDIDSKMVELASENQELVNLNERAFFDKRVSTYIKDARVFVKSNRKVYDLIIIDFPDPSNELLAGLYTVELFEELYDSLSAAGLIVCQSNALDAAPTVFWSIGLTFERAGFYTDQYHTIIPSFGDWGFTLASKKRLSRRFTKRNGFHRTLPAEMRSLFEFQPDYLHYKKRASVNSQRNLNLHTIFNEENA